MAVYNLQNIDFQYDGQNIIASGDIMKDGVLMQGFSVNIEPARDASKLVAQVADHVLPIVNRDILISDIFLQAKTTLEGREISG